MSNLKRKIKDDKFAKIMFIIAMCLSALDIIVAGYLFLKDIIISGKPLFGDLIISDKLLVDIVFAINFIVIGVPTFIHLYKNRKNEVQNDDETKSH